MMNEFKIKQPAYMIGERLAKFSNTLLHTRFPHSKLIVFVHIQRVFQRDSVNMH